MPTNYTQTFAGILLATPATAAEISDTTITKYALLNEGITVQCVAFPHKYIQLSSWKTTPNQREEIKAYRDDNTRNLTRVTAAGRKTPIQFKTRPRLSLEGKKAIQSFFTIHESDAAERKIVLAFWNDESNEYRFGSFYRANTEFTIEKITDTDIMYAETTIDLVEY